MKSLDDAAYRLKLAQGYLARAEGDAQTQKWDGCLANAQEAVENAGKSILAHFIPIPRTHNLVTPLENLVQLGSVPAIIQKQIAEALEAFMDMGLETHVRAAYGDEAAHIPPWELITETEARGGLDKARRAAVLAENIYTQMMQLPPNPPTE